MAYALLISNEDVVKFSILNGNIDTDKYIQYIKIAQDITIQNYLGTDLYNKFQDLIINNTLNDVGNANYKALLSTYIKPMLIHWAMVHYLPFSAYTIANKGVFKHTSENAESVSKTEIDYLVEKERDIAEHYTQRFIDYICFNNNLFPEYNSNSNGDMYPDRSNFYGSWVL